MSLHNAHPTLLCGFRAEFEVWVSASIDDAHMIVNSYNFNDGIPDGVCVRKRVKVEEYLKQLESCFQGAIDRGVTVGRAKECPNFIQIPRCFV